MSSFEEVFEVELCRLAGVRVRSRFAQKTQAAERGVADASEERCGRSAESAREVMDRIVTRRIKKVRFCS